MKMNKLSLTTLLLSTMILLFGASAAHSKTESEYAVEHCATVNGQVEHVLKDSTRVDCLTEYDAIEYDFTYKWYECITQALYYRKMTGMQALCGLIRKNGTYIETEHIKRAIDTVKEFNIPVYIFVIDQ